MEYLAKISIKQGKFNPKKPETDMILLQFTLENAPYPYGPVYTIGAMWDTEVDYHMLDLGYGPPKITDDSILDFIWAIEGKRNSNWEDPELPKLKGFVAWCEKNILSIKRAKET